MIYGTLALLGVYLLSRKSFTIWRHDVKKYLTRFYLVGPWFRTLFNCRPYLHHFHASDDLEYHSHKWRWAYCLILWGGYTEHKKVWSGWCWLDKVRTYRPFSINKLDSNTFHRVDLLNEKRGCWSLVLCGPHDASYPDWGFLRNDGTVEYAMDRFRGKRDALSDD